MPILIDEFIKTDKYYWHRFLPEYERLVFRPLENHATCILEWGVLEGESIKILLQRLPEAKIVGIDILDKKPSWPDDDDVQYFKVNQNSLLEIREFYRNYNHSFDLIIDDASHVPYDQATCLRESLKWVRKGGFYIIEDIHTSFQYDAPLMLHVMLCLKHCQEIGNMNGLKQLANPDFLCFSELEYLYNEIQDIHLFKRACLPLKCWKCKGNDFDYIKLKCKCGTAIFSQIDSMTCIIKKKMS